MQKTEKKAVAKNNHYARIYNTMAIDVVKPFYFHNSREGFCRLLGKNNSREGFCRLLGKMSEAMESERAERVIIGMEPTGHYWKPLAYFLKEVGYTVVIVNPYHVKNNKEMEDNSQDKNDRKDAGIIAQLVKEGKFLHCILPEGIYAELRTLYILPDSNNTKNLTLLSANLKP